MFLVFIVISLSLTILSMVIERRRSLPKQPNVYIFCIRFIHFMTLLFLFFYIFAFDSQYDILYIIFVVCVYGHWLCLNNQCLLSKLETDYYFGVIGNRRIHNIYLWVFAGEYTRNLLLTLSILSIINFVVVILRQRWLHDNVKLAIIVLFFVYLSYMYKQRQN